MNVVKRAVRAFALKAVGNLLSETVQLAIQRSMAVGLGQKHPPTPQQADANKGWAFAANRQICGRAARVAPVLELWQRNGSMPWRKTPIHVHPMLDLMEQPNADETGLIFMWRQVLHLQVYGRYYCLIEPEIIDLTPLLGDGERYIAHRIGAMRLLEPERTTPIATRSRWGAFYRYVGLRGERHDYAGAPVTRAEREAWKRDPYPYVFRQVFPSPDSYDGISPMQMGADAVNAVAGITQMTNGLLQNGIHAGLIFYLMKEIEDPERFEKAVLLLKQGLGRAGEPLVLTKPVAQVAENPAKYSDMQFPEAYQRAREELLAVLGGSEGAVGLSKSVNRSVIEGLERIMALGTIDPLTSLIADGYNRYVLPTFAGQSDSSKYKLRFPSSATMDDLSVATKLKTLTDGRIYTPNDAREELGKRPHPDGNNLVTMTRLTEQAAVTSEVLDPLSGDPTGELAEDAAGASSGDGDDGSGGMPNATEPGGTNPGQVQAPKTNTGQVQPPKGSKSKTKALPAGDCGCGDQRATRTVPMPAGHPLATEEARAVKWRALADTRAAQETKFRKAVAAIFRDWRDQVTELVTVKGADVFGRGRNQMDENPWVDDFTRAYTDWAAPVIAERAREALGDAGFDPDLVDTEHPQIQQVVERRGPAFAAAIVATTQERLAAVMTGAVQDGLTPEEAAGAAYDVFPASSNAGRVRTIAATEAVIAHGKAIGLAMLALREAAASNDAGNDDAGDGIDTPAEAAGAAAAGGGKVGLMWLSQRDNLVRDSHAIADGQIVADGEMFSVGGCTMRWPGDDESCGDLGEIANCRCEAVLVPLGAY